MNILILKEVIDDLSAYSSFIFKATPTKDIFTLFKSKTNGIYSILEFQTDFKIINRKPTLKYKKNLREDVNRFIHKNTKNVYNINEVNFDDYDIIWCRDAILDNINELKIKYPQILFVYEDVEHSWRSNNFNYDLILDHTNFDFKLPIQLNKSISFPYVSSPLVIRKEFNTNKEYDIYFDNRDMMTYTKHQKCSIIIEYCRNKYNLNLITNLLDTHIYPQQGKKKRMKNEAYSYLKKIAQSKFFILTTKRLGQSLVEAAALKCIVIGSKKSINSKFICHPYCLFNDFTSLDNVLSKVKDIESKPKLQEEILEYQEKLLFKNYVEYQRKVLERGLELKKKN